MSAENGHKPILDLDDLIEEHGATWTYRGVTYEYVRWSLLGLIERRRITKRSDRINTLEALDEPSEAEAAEYELIVRELIGLATEGIADDVIDTMTRDQQCEVVTRFLALRLLRTSDLADQRHQAIGAWRTAGLPITATSSPASTPAGRKKRARG